MNNRKDRTAPLKIAALHPFLFGLFPVLFLYAHNVGEMRAREMILPGLAIVGLILAAFFVLAPVIRNIHKRALLLSAFVVLFFSFGHAARLISDWGIFADARLLTPERAVFGLWLLLLIAAAVLILRTGRNLSRFSLVLNQVAVALVLIQVALAGYTLVLHKEARRVETGPVNVRPDAGPTPDIYFIILDGYGRHDILKEIYNVDNSDFLAALNQRGFRILDSSYSNYCATAQSLTATLNLDYLDRVLDVDWREFSRQPAAVKLERNRVIDFLHRYGYSVVAFSTGYAPTEVEFADYFFKPAMALSEFQNHLLNDTPIPFLTRSIKSQFDLHRDRLQFILAKLRDLQEVPSPKFVFAHVNMPHPPFVYDKDGHSIERDWPFSFADGDHYAIQGGTLEEYIKGYGGQVQYVSKTILPVIDSIIGHSKLPPIIVMQGDHGPGSRLYWENPYKTDHHERFAILNAIRLPGAPDSLLYDSMSPVNTFRVILDHYFNTRFGILPDRSYYTTRSHPYDFIDVTDYLHAAEQPAPADSSVSIP